MSDYDSDSNSRGDDVYDYDSDIGYHIGGLEYAGNAESVHTSEYLYSMSDCLFGEKKNRAPVAVEAGEEVNQAVNPEIIVISDDESDDDGPIPMKNKAELDGRSLLREQIEQIKQALEQVRAYYDNRQDRDMMTAGPVVVPFQQPPREHSRSFSI